MGLAFLERVLPQGAGNLLTNPNKTRSKKASPMGSGDRFFVPYCTNTPRLAMLIAALRVALGVRVLHHQGGWKPLGLPPPYDFPFCCFVQANFTRALPGGLRAEPDVVRATPLRPLPQVIANCTSVASTMSRNRDPKLF